jgi:hypothetical protein
MPTMPPEHTVMPAARTASSVVELGRRVEVGVVRGEPRLAQADRLRRREHAEGDARLHLQGRHAADHVEHRVERRAVSDLAPRRAHAETQRVAPAALARRAAASTSSTARSRSAPTFVS